MCRFEFDYNKVQNQLDNIEYIENYKSVIEGITNDDPIYHRYKERIIDWFKNDYPTDSNMITRLKNEVRNSYLLEAVDHIDLYELIDILQLVKVFSNQHHSGASYQCVIDKVDSIIRFKPWTPLTGENNEWTDISGESGCFDEDHVYQNKRCVSVVKIVNNDTITYEDNSPQEYILPNGKSFIDNDSVKIIKGFPYMPVKKPIYLYDNNGGN